jgi:hypothetical protein
MHEVSSIARIENALGQASPRDALAALVKVLKAEGVTQTEMYGQFDTLRVKYDDPATEAKYDALLDTMDIISGWCRPEQRLFETELRR